jgi:hypothetical protein
VFNNFGIRLRSGDPDRVLKIRQFRERLKLPAGDLEMPMMVVYRSCSHFIMTIPSLAIGEDNPEDIDTEQEDHVYDETYLICMARPVWIPEYEIQAQVEAEVKRQQREQLEPSHQKVWSELDEIRERLQKMEEHEQTGSVVSFTIQ